MKLCFYNQSKANLGLHSTYNVHAVWFIYNKFTDMVIKIELFDLAVIYINLKWGGGGGGIYSH